MSSVDSVEKLHHAKIAIKAWTITLAKGQLANVVCKTAVPWKGILVADSGCGCA